MEVLAPYHHRFQGTYSGPVMASPLNSTSKSLILRDRRYVPPAIPRLKLHARITKLLVLPDMPPKTRQRGPRIQIDVARIKRTALVLSALTTIRPISIFRLVLLVLFTGRTACASGWPPTSSLKLPRLLTGGQSVSAHLLESSN